MKRPIVLLLSIAVLLSITAFAFGQLRFRLFRPRCGPNGCELVPIPQPTFDEQQGVQPDPVNDPEPPAKAIEPSKIENFGVDCSKIAGDKCYMNGREVTMAHALGVIGGQIPDDSKKLRLTVIGSDVDRKPVMDALAQLEPALRERLTPWSVRPDHWSLKDGVTGQTVFKADGKPTVYVQAPDGKVLHRQDDFAGPEDFQAIRKVVKAYDAGKDVDLRKSPAPDDKKPVPATPAAPINSPWLLIGGAAIVFLLLRSQGKL